jgi:hypothetical protein
MKKNSLTPKKCVKVEKVSELWGITVFCNAAANIKNFFFNGAANSLQHQH